jgi:hypothetical protein
MLKFNHTLTSSPREKLLEMRIENLQERIRELEQKSLSRYSSPTDGKNTIETNRSSFLVLPITYTPSEEPSPILEIVPYSTKNQSKIPLLLVEQSKSQVYETVV